MELTREQKRLLMLHEYRLESTAADATRRIKVYHESLADGKMADWER
jgi:hypothetical protein